MLVNLGELERNGEGGRNNPAGVRMFPRGGDKGTAGTELNRARAGPGRAVTAAAALQGLE